MYNIATILLHNDEIPVFLEILALGHHPLDQQYLDTWIPMPAWKFA